ncbi:von Willebrand factor D and EGF domain-containing protein-like [Mytilus edulis]|uniref:von Willebrand factor D and EGF domain-containing protein-like n=1 Tax=Mytilus edulis TaxID=6550 RepID=UPI0039EEA9B5
MACAVIWLSLFVVNLLTVLTIGNKGRGTYSNHYLHRYKRSDQSFCAARPEEQCCLGNNCCRVNKNDVSCCCDEYCLIAHDCCPDYERTCQAGPCNQYSIIQDQEKRSVGYTTDQSTDDIISDDMLNNTWYRVISRNGDEIATHPPGIYHCGTLNPIWLNGSLPDGNEENVTREACLQTVDGICEEKIAIEIVNCSEGFHVYRLQNTTANSAYCFGSGPVLCADGLSSESGYYPGCSSSFPNETAHPEVEVILVEGPVYNVPNYEPTPSLSSTFQCSFEVEQQDSFVYDIYWYINGNSVTVFKDIPNNDLRGTILKDKDWKGKYQMNMDVTCSVRIRYSAGSLPGPFYKSPVYKAGFYPEKYEYTVIEGEHVNIAFTSTVPIGCIASHPDILSNCYQNFYIYQPQYDNEEPVRCKNNIVNRDVVFRTKFCGIKVGNLDWKEKKHLQVYGFSDGLYNHQDRSTFIRFSTTSVSDVNHIWQHIKIADIKLSVIDKDSALTSRLCQSYNDPHITTFDGRAYHYMDIGEHVIYRNDRGPYWVHALFTNCGFGWAGSACHCGIAIRSRQSLFVLRTCKKISRKEKYLLDQPITEIRTCVDSDMSVVSSGDSYTVTLPIGTEIKFTVSTYSRFITMVSVKPSIYDINEARGLCGVPSATKDPSDDFHHREQGPITDDQKFAHSWKIHPSTNPKEQLFIPNPHFLSEEPNIEIEIENDNSNANVTTGTYCICEKQAGSVGEEFYTAQCSLSDSTQYCPSDEQLLPGNEKPNNPVVTVCTSSKQRRSLSHRSRRSVTDTDDVILDNDSLDYDDDVNDNITELPFRNGWTEEKANLTCTDRIKKSLPSELPDIPGLSDYDYIQSCIMDIKFTAGTDFVQDTVGAAQTKTIMELSRNETLSLTETDDGSQTILDYVTSLLCPNNCTENGNCTSGVCSCNNGYIGDDCSEEMSKPPLNISLPANGLCGTRTRACKRTNIYGTFKSKTIWCRRRHFRILDGLHKYTSDYEVIKADYRNLFMISVNLESPRRKRSTDDAVMADGFELSLSNDGKQFGNSVNIFIFDEQCFKCDTKSKKCYLLDSCPVTTTEPQEAVTG